LPEIIKVAAGALIDSQGQVLIARRHDDAHQGGLWEFPGGKCEVGESTEAALKRELNEELGIEVTGHRPLIRVTHHYNDLSVLLDVHRVDTWDGEVHAREDQPLAWVPPGKLGDYPMPAADVPIVHALQLPERYLITPAAVPDQQLFLNNLEKALHHGVRLVQLRVFDLPQATYLDLAAQVQQLCEANDARLLINGEAELAQHVGAAGLHLSSRQLLTLAARPKGVGLLSVSCHNADELNRAQELRADCAVLSPVLPTRSHPDASPLGWDRFAQLVDEVAMPVYALGGMRPDLINVAWANGAQGIAGIRGLWPAKDRPA